MKGIYHMPLENVNSLALEKANRRLREAEDTIRVLEDCLRGLLKHCNPDIPPGPNLWNARNRALNAIKELYGH